MNRFTPIEEPQSRFTPISDTKDQVVTAGATGRPEDTLQVWNPATLINSKATNFDTGINIGEDVSNFLAGAGKSFYDTARGIGQIAGAVSREDVDEQRKLDAELSNTKAGKFGEFSGAVAQFLPTVFIPGANTATGATLAGAGMGAIGPVGTDESRLTNAVTGAVLGVAGHGAGKVIGKTASSVSNKIAKIEQKIAEKSAAMAASETASARSAAGNAAQNAYRQLEHLRELKASRAFTPDEDALIKSLEKELSDKALEKLIPAAALKNETSAAYSEAMRTEAERATKIAAEKLSGNEVKQQMMARIKRYGPAAVGGMVGNMIFPGLGGSVGGAATGLVLRPAIRSMFNLAKNPAVQHKLLSTLENRFASDPNLPTYLRLLGPSIYAAQE